MVAERKIGGRYTLEVLVGQGGMGAVYRGIDTESGQPVAVKALKPGAITNNPEVVERFIREGEALRQLNHPNIVHMLDMLEDGGAYFLVMEYVGGGSLFRLLREIPTPPVERVLEIALDLADALTRAHRLHIIHRDIKPANILLAEDGTPRLADFGVARMDKPRITETGLALGTVSYLSPEALANQEIDPRADIWSFGVLLFEMLAGYRPFQSDQMGLVITMIMVQPTPDLEAIRPDAPAALVDLVYRMLEKDRMQRIPSARQVGVELEAILRDYKRLTHAPVLPSDSGRFQAPPSRARHNLPTQMTPFVGREAELAELEQLLHDRNTRLINIIGPGGIGKTRLALELALRFAAIGDSPPVQTHLFPGGVYIVHLETLESAEHFVRKIAETLDLHFSGEHAPKEQLLNYLSEKQMLLILDSFDQLPDGIWVLNEILQAAAGIRIIATSRERLQLQEEIPFRVEGMGFPTQASMQDALNSAAVQLFIQSARRLLPGFKAETDDLPHIIRICQQVGGMPLAIMLAAGWVNTLSLPEIAAEIEQSVDFLETDAQNVPERYRSIRAVFDSSWNQLAESEHEIFMKLAIFRGGFSREAVQTVAGTGLGQLAVLVNKSLLRRDAISGRYEIHILLQQYAEEKLAEAGQLALVQQLHTNYFLELVETLAPREYIDHDLDWLDTLVADMDNIEAAILRCAQDPDGAEMEARLVGGFGRVWYRRGHWLEGLHWVRETLRRKDKLSPLVYANVLAAGGHSAFALGNYEQADLWHSEALEIYRDQRDSFNTAFMLYCLASRVSYLPDAKMQVEEALQIAYREGSRWLIRVANINYGEYLRLGGNYEKALEVMLEGAALAERDRDMYSAQYYMINLADVYINLGNFDAATQYCQQALAISSELQDSLLEAGAAVLSAEIALLQSDTGLAATQLDGALQIARDIGSIWAILQTQLTLAQLYRLTEDKVAAQKLLRDMLHALNRQPSVASGNEMPGRFLNTVAGILLDGGDYEQAVRYFGAADADFESRGIVRRSPEHARYEQDLAHMRGALGSVEAFDNAYNGGRNLTFAQAVEEIQNAIW